MVGNSLELEWSERAIQDYERLTEYLYEQWGEKLTLRVLEGIYHQIGRVMNNPEQFPIFIKENLIRRCVASSQTSIFFVVKPEKIFLLSIFDNRLNPDKYPS